ncbi:MAG: aminopeptidase N, partial [Betaproteobacteria bacterium]|nr:aminopeptidase N [Betaproteobacteria bacterium]
MREPTPQTIHLKDYRAPAFLVPEIALDFDVHEDFTRVRACLTLERNPAAAGGEGAGAPLLLNGEALEREMVSLDGRVLSAGEFERTDGHLRIAGVPDRFTLETTVRIEPRKNLQLSGLYGAKAGFFTQCEAEGFRRITFFPDRPDVMSRYSVTIHADREACPVLLSNGNLVDSGAEGDGRHWARWVDPFPKPCYLFAMVAARLDVLEDRWTTRSGRAARLAIYVDPGKLDQCAYAMDSLKRSMKWDEEVFGLELDLDHYMIVAVGDFNMGAMENKGLNIFNTKYVLARPDTATDMDFMMLDRVVAHEYFHNWTGNRVTCRDWFQLSLKEGLTVFRDQEYGADTYSRPVQRIQEVRSLRAGQFPEDAGPMAHPVRPQSYMEISNFYTATVYEKGAEVVRMIHTLIGAEAFRRGMDLYFRRHDGQAVTCDDFVQAMADASGRDLIQFRRWYDQAGTPVLEVSDAYHAAARRYTLSVRQSCPPTPERAEKLPFHIPLALGLLLPDGSEAPPRLAGEAAAGATDRVLDVTESEQEFVFEDVPARPVPSLLRRFSAPVALKHDYSED